MSYYQMVSLKLQLGLDPDEQIECQELLQMWRAANRMTAAPACAQSGLRLKHNAVHRPGISTSAAG